jgi:ABC-type multidrug transport system fused ATPase/permease subunit
VRAVVLTDAAAKVSLDRVNEFLQDSELLDEFAAKKDGGAAVLAPPAPADEWFLGFQDAEFTWAASDGSATPGRRPFRLRVAGTLAFPRGAFSIIVGPTGAGKTSVLMALLGEMHFAPGALGGARAGLPRAGGVAYAAQESWVQNETIRDNILFGAPLDQARYDAVVEQCGLARDLTLFEAGDMTEVGEKGLTLSGGQKARITLARAVYSSAECVARRGGRWMLVLTHAPGSCSWTTCSRRWTCTRPSGSSTAASAATCCAGGRSSSSRTTSRWPRPSRTLS